MAWLYSIYNMTGVRVPFPIIADRSGEIARKYGMVSVDMSKIATFRSVFIIDDKGKIRLMMTYPMSVRRSINEIFRVVNELQNATPGARLV